jgi:putative flippase GtrA
MGIGDRLALERPPQRASRVVIADRIDMLRRHEVLGQLFRFAIAGGLATVVYTVVYWPVATYGHRLFALGRGAGWPLVGNVLGYLAAMVTGYFLHSRWSFRGHGSRDDAVKTSSRFFVVSLVSFALNTFFVWLLTGPLFHGATWWPLVPILFVTPLVTFALNRLWVFA